MEPSIATGLEQNARLRSRTELDPTLAATPANASRSPEFQLRALLAERLGASRFGLWFGEGVQLGVSSDALEVAVPNAFFRDRIRAHFTRELADAGLAVTGRALEVRFRLLDDETHPTPSQLVSEPERVALDTSPRPVQKSSTVPATLPLTPEPPAPVATLLATAPSVSPTLPPLPSGPQRPSRRLEDFVSGGCNKMALAAAHEVVQTLGRSFSPLVIQGGVGLGKTHLLEGIGAALRARHPGLKVVHLTGEAFTNGFLEALRLNKLPAFRARYRGAGALLIDDVHFLAAKRATQDEFLHTFNALAAEGAPIVLTMDQHPRKVQKLTDELATRFLGGMVVTLEPPDLATRRAILKAKAAARGVNVPEAVISYVAEHLRASVRELEGALHSLIAHATLTGKRLDLALAKTALRDTIRHTAKTVALKDVERAVCNLFEIEPEVLKSGGRARTIAYPRMIAMYLARKQTGAAYSEIGRFFGGRNHSTVISAEKKVAHWLDAEQKSPWLPGFETVGEVIAALERTLGDSA